MTKREAIEWLSLGDVWKPYEMVLSIYDDDQEVYDGLLDELARPPDTIQPRMILMNPKMIQEIDSWFSTGGITLKPNDAVIVKPTTT